MFEEASVVFLV